MPTDEPINSYKFVWIGGEFNSYAFTTNHSVGYEVRFVPSAYLFKEYIEHYIDAYEMIIAVADNPTVVACRLTR